MCWHSAWIFLISCVYSYLPLCPQAWWITNNTSTDLWGKWILTNSGWHYTNLKDYPEGKFLAWMTWIGYLFWGFFVLLCFFSHQKDHMLTWCDLISDCSDVETDKMLIGKSEHTILKAELNIFFTINHSNAFYACLDTKAALCLSSSQHVSNSVCLFCPCAVAEYLQTIQATSVLACVFAILALFVFVAQLFTLPKGQRFTFTGILQLIACK